MDGTDFGQFIYLTILAIALLGWFLAENRRAFGRTIRLAIAWTMIFVGTIAAYGLWSDVKDDLVPRQTIYAEESRIEVPRAIDGHYYLTLDVNGVAVDFVVDTGATEVVLTREDAARVGLHPDEMRFFGVANTANGQVAIATARADELRLGPISDRDVRISVNSGEMDTSLLGMSYLDRFDRIEISNAQLVLER